MPNTPNRGYPYPSNTNAAAVPADLKALVDPVDADVQGLLDQVESRVAGINVNAIWAGTWAEYSALTPDPATVYIIVDRESEDPNASKQQMGSPVTTSLTSTSASSITPKLPIVPAGWWGYLLVVMNQGWTSQPWTIPAGWTRFYDNTQATASRTVGVFSAPAGTPSAPFIGPSGTAQRYVAMAFPVRRQPVLSGHLFGASAPFDSVTVPQMLLSPPGIPLTLIQANYSGVTSANLPTADGVTAGVGSGSAIVNGSGSVTMMFADVGSYGDVATVKNYPLSPAMGSEPSFYRIGVS